MVLEEKGWDRRRKRRMGIEKNKVWRKRMVKFFMVVRIV